MLDGLGFVFLIALFIGGGLAIFLNTPAGKRWNENL